MASTSLSSLLLNQSPACNLLRVASGRNVDPLHRSACPILESLPHLSYQKTRVARVFTASISGAANPDFTSSRRTTSSRNTSKDTALQPCSALKQILLTPPLQEPEEARLVQELPVGPLIKEDLSLYAPLQSSPEPHEEARVIRELVPLIKEKLSRIRNSYGEISVSAYDTAWVARIPDANGSDGPHFPRTLEWIVANQHPDGSWGDARKDWLYDRFIQTLACIVALKSWNRCPSSIQRGEEYMTRNAHRLGDEEILTMPIGFEISFPGLLSEAQSLGLNLPYTTPFFGVLEQLRDKKLQRVPLELLHSQPTTLLHTLEGMQSLDIDWERVLKFQSEDGSICCSPSSTAALYMNTGDKKCLSFLEGVLLKFNDAVPTCYPLDTFHNLWVVDTLERLGISRFFQEDIQYILGEVYRHWSDEQGICWASVLKDVPDLDDTSMAFRLLRQHGYNVSAEGFKVFQKEKGFACFAVGQMVQGVSDMYNLLRASQTAYPGEERLVAAESFSRGFLVNALADNKGDADKWSLKKDLSGEIEYALKHPNQKSFHRMHIRQYLDKYGPEDAWIGKSIYRLGLVNDPDYLTLATADFKLCQKLHQQELGQILRWISDSGLVESSRAGEEVVSLYTMFSAELWEPELSAVRIAAGKCMFIAQAMRQLFTEQSSLTDSRKLVEAVQRWDPSTVPEKFKSCFMVLYNTLNETVKSSNEHESDLLEQLVHIWERLLSAFLAEAEGRAQISPGPKNEAHRIAIMSSGLEATVLSSLLMSGEIQNPHLVTLLEKDSPLMTTADEAMLLARGISPRKNASIIPMDESDIAMMQQQILKELNFLHWGQKSNLPSIVKRVVLTFIKVANVYYDRDREQILAELALGVA